jgi:uncharacterized protein (TIGR00369 family)
MGRFFCKATISFPLLQRSICPCILLKDVHNFDNCMKVLIEENNKESNKMKNDLLECEDFFTLLKNLYEERLPFNKMLGIQVVKISFDDLCVRLDMKAELVGNYVKGILHGGVISSLLDLTGGLIASVGVLKRMLDCHHDEIKKRFMRISTIDLRVDYLSPGKGKYFLTEGSILRIGNKVAVIRTELKNDNSVLIAAGTGTYIVG